MDAETLTRRLEKLEAEHAELERRLGSGPDAFASRGEYETAARRHSALAQAVPAIHERRKVLRDLKHDDEILRGPDRDLWPLAEAEKTELTERLAALESRLLIELLPKDPHHDRAVYVEVRAGAGGDEAALFASELMRMYLRYAQLKGWPAETVESSSTGLKGIKQATMFIKGPGAYSLLKFEGGVHRVQRVPATEGAGRIHTSTCTVAVMWEVEEVEVVIDPKELRIDTYRAGGAGGQNVNKVETAIRITHLPTNLVVQCQDQRSQGQNRIQAMAMLRAKLAAAQREAEAAKQGGLRRAQVGTGDRSEKIRTYNFPQSRVTDHRIGASWHNLAEILEGALDPVVLALAEEALKRSLAEEAS